MRDLEGWVAEEVAELGGAECVGFRVQVLVELGDWLSIADKIRESDQEASGLSREDFEGVRDFLGQKPSIELSQLFNLLDFIIDGQCKVGDEVFILSRDIFDVVQVQDFLENVVALLDVLLIDNGRFHDLRQDGDDVLRQELLLVVSIAGGELVQILLHLIQDEFDFIRLLSQLGQQGHVVVLGVIASSALDQINNRSGGSEEAGVLVGFGHGDLPTEHVLGHLLALVSDQDDEGIAGGGGEGEKLGGVLPVEVEGGGGLLAVGAAGLPDLVHGGREVGDPVLQLNGELGELNETGGRIQEGKSTVRRIICFEFESFGMVDSLSSNQFSDDSQSVFCIQFKSSLGDFNDGGVKEIEGNLWAEDPLDVYLLLNLEGLVESEVRLDLARV